ncbi:hypothetical protein ACHAXT_006078 [Thalassiosira profunda]
MLFYDLTRRLNKAVAPAFLKYSLKLHESLTAAALPRLAPLALLPVAQRLASIELQDDYRHLGLGSATKGDKGDSFVDQVWDVLFEDRHQRLKAQREEKVEDEVQRQWKERQERRRMKHNQLAKDRKEKQRKDNVHELSKQRVQTLERYIRPALLPTGSSGDQHRHLFAHHDQSDDSPTDGYDRFVRWIRGEYLVARYGLAVSNAIKRHPELRDDAAGLSTVEVATDEVPLKLPSVAMVEEAFGMKDWNRQKVPYASWGEEDDNLQSDANELDIEQLIHHKLKGQIAHSGPLNAYFEMRRREDSYELWTRDYIFGLAQYLLGRIAEMDEEQGLTKTIVLDVGAGDGRLVYFLRRAMKEIAKKRDDGPTDAPTTLPIIIATDDGSWRAPIYKNNSDIEVERLSTLEALSKYEPRADEQEGWNRRRLIVLCSWMPPGEDWTADFRLPTSPASDAHDDSEKAVERLAEEYVLIGEADDGTCGHNWYTWGNPAFYPGEEEAETKDAPYAVDGYTRVDLKALSQLQFSRFDCRRSSESQTVSFRRGPSS